ncbi:MAG: ROK family protein, partial [Alicyclobacillus sp.]|nr:ROK family protein [Alicyclobacillus sp.]
HTVVDPHGTLCTCGNIGCLETVASGRALVLEYRKMLQYVGRSASDDVNSYEIADILSEADRGQDIAKILVSRAGRAIGVSIANLVNILNVDTVVLGGTLISKEGVMNQSILDGIYECLLPRLRTRLRIRHSVLGSHAAYAGMAYLCLLKLFNTVSVV